ncbi:MAG: thioredoxin domain-containing protein [Thaumarchaeota archaeon]|nr:thioredoxin domain-containing protein [Nitrososphaerota archaeon]
MHANRLAKETSPYLLQHAHNPVDWYPWGEEAFARARKEDKPILLSIGYSACHWCHVMEKESFEDEESAKIMNDNFVSIKVDREERPDLDTVYMEAVQALTGSGGWPMTVFLTPDGKPFFGGTYFPPDEGHGLPSFKRVLAAISEAYKARKQEVMKDAEQLHKRLNEKIAVEKAELNNLPIEVAFLQLDSSFDRINGGFGRAPKFPQPTALELLIRIGRRQGFAQANKMVEFTLLKMAQGGVYDHLGGGFHRYSVDSRWLVPHFEKMLYDNALLSRVYLHDYQINKNPISRKIVEETIDYVLREMTDANGGFYSTQDADSEGEEGKFYVWTKQEIERILGTDAESFCAYYGVTAEGNFEGKNILNIQTEPSGVASMLKSSVEKLEETMTECRKKLLAERNKRIKPGRDDKVLASWNGLMLSGMSEAARVLGREDYLNAAENNAEFILGNMEREGRLLHVWKDGTVKINGYLEDYAFLADGLIELYQSTFNPRWLAEAKKMANMIIDHFEDKNDGGYYDTSDDHEQLIARPKSSFDSALPSGGSAAAQIMLKLFAYTGDTKFAKSTEKALRSVSTQMENYPTGLTNWLIALDYLLNPPKEVAISGSLGEEITKRMLRIISETYRPDIIVALQPAGKDYSEMIPLLKDRIQLEGETTAYVCKNFTCDLPTSDPEKLRMILQQ